MEQGDEVTRQVIYTHILINSGYGSPGGCQADPSWARRPPSEAAAPPRRGSPRKPGAPVASPVPPSTSPVLSALSHCPYSQKALSATFYDTRHSETTRFCSTRHSLPIIFSCYSPQPFPGGILV
ncbi:hypothetical protein Pcinc_033159 [Petrolisthes cinctipes]|uniref:Uncharacterized protein n=1 Tax=Petrolisthes cinctipes TaxID=88211 RepID=A0AAE1ESN1_PETCI|nr:hypothetical protein Pcinc_033159 [Petrolisthes cinctipes]